jgi:hypothetical protein
MRELGRGTSCCLSSAAQPPTVVGNLPLIECVDAFLRLSTFVHASGWFVFHIPDGLVFGRFVLDKGGKKNQALGKRIRTNATVRRTLDSLLSYIDLIVLSLLAGDGFC